MGNTNETATERRRNICNHLSSCGCIYIDYCSCNSSKFQTPHHTEGLQQLSSHLETQLDRLWGYTPGELFYRWQAARSSRQQHFIPREAEAPQSAAAAAPAAAQQRWAVHNCLLSQVSRYIITCSRDISEFTVCLMKRATLAASLGRSLPFLLITFDPSRRVHGAGRPPDTMKDCDSSSSGGGGARACQQSSERNQRGGAEREGKSFCARSH